MRSWQHQTASHFGEGFCCAPAQCPFHESSGHLVATYSATESKTDTLLSTFSRSRWLLVETNPFPKLSLFYRTMLFEYPSVLSRFCLTHIKVFRSTARHPTQGVGSIRCGSSKMQKNFTIILNLKISTLTQPSSPLIFLPCTQRFLTRNLKAC